MLAQAISRQLSVVLPALLLLWCGFERRWIGDDGFINVRVVRQLLAGHGFVFNVGERVEAVTSPLWVLLVTGLSALGLPVEDSAVFAGLALTGAGLLLCGYAGLRALGPARGERVVYLPLGALAYAALPAAWDYATSALENGFTLFWLGLSAFLVSSALRAPSRRALLLAALVICSTPLVRPDCALLVLPLGVLLGSLTHSWRQRLLLLAVGSLPLISFQIFRMGYFAALVPNTALAKEAFRANWPQGLHYLWNTVGLYWLLIPLACVFVDVGLSARGAALRLRAALLLGGLLHVAYVVRVGGDFMHARLLLPGLAALLCASPIARLSAPRSASMALRAASCAALCAWAVYCGSSLRVAAENEHGIGDERGWFVRESGVAHPTHSEDYERFLFYQLGAQLRDQVARTCPRGRADLEPEASARCGRIVVPDGPAQYLARNRSTLPLRDDAAPSSVAAVVRLGPLGIVGVMLGPRISLVDAYGLADPIAARMELAARGRPGHEKFFPPPWFAARYVVPGETTDPSVRVAAEVLECEPVRELTRAVREPLSFARFVANLGVALRAHRLRIAADPHAARAELCGAS